MLQSNQQAVRGSPWPSLEANTEVVLFPLPLLFLCGGTKEVTPGRLASTQEDSFNFFPTRSGPILCGADIHKKVSTLAASQLLKYTSVPRSCSTGPLHLLRVCEGNNLGPPPVPSASHPFANAPSCMKSDHCQRVPCLTCTTWPHKSLSLHCTWAMPSVDQGTE